MSTRQRIRDHEPTPGPDDTPAAAAERRERWEAASRLAAAADAVIDQDLSEDSDAYLRASRQRGGQ